MSIIDAVWYTVYITDKNNVEQFVETCTKWGLVSAMSNLERKVQQAMANPDMYIDLFDIATAKVVAVMDMATCPYDIDDSIESMSDEDLLAELGV